MAPLLLAAVFGALLKVTSAAVSPSALGTDLTVLFQNDLNWTTFADHQAAILLSTPLNASDAVAACAALNETLLWPHSPSFTSDFKTLLQYEYEERRDGISKRQLYWSSAVNGSVVALKATRETEAVSKSKKLPVLCADSAGFTSTANGTLPTQWEFNPPSNKNWQVQVASENLTFVGTRDELSFRFLGVPYVNPPERFAYSTPYIGPSEIDATAYRPNCLQVSPFATGSEDCLYLNIFTPYLPSDPPTSTKLRPVLFWIHGGSYLEGTGNDPTFDGGSLASRGDIVVVAINYRLSTLGFLSLPDGHTNGSFGIGDMVNGLKWVQQHIRAFGGDPSRVTLAGQSVGATSVRVILGSPPAAGTFQAALLMSDPAGGSLASAWTTYDTIQEAYESVTVPILAATGCNSTTNFASQLSCLKAIDPLTLINLTAVASAPVVDGFYVPTDQLHLDGSAYAAKVPVLMGQMKDDAAAALVPQPPNDTLAQYVQSSWGLDPATIQDILGSNLFPEPTGSNTTLDIYNTTTLIGTDIIFRCFDQATVFAGRQNNIFPKAWYYEFQRSYQLNWFNPVPPLCTPPITADFPLGDPNMEYFKCHEGELYYTFGTLGRAALPFRDANDLLFSQQMLDRWSSFVRTHDPNPDPEYLKVRGYETTLEVFKKQGKWAPVGESNNTDVRLLNVPESAKPWQDLSQCTLLNMSLTTFV